MHKPEIRKQNNSFAPKSPKELKKLFISNTLSLGLILVLLIAVIFSRTVAWQTNVVHTGGLMFTADAWSFNAEITMVSQNTPAAPGQSGTIDIRITNDSSQLAVASVKVLKDQIAENMRNRMFFYADAPTVKNGENVKVQYLNSKNSYAYAVFPHQVLTLSANNAQQPLIKWEWTYDNLGYYVSGYLNNANVQVEEYLMPIKYNFDSMHTTFDKSGSLKTIDGTITKEEFITEFSKSDGYSGTIDPASVTSDGFYPVEVDAQTGYGVFAYLSTIDQINQGSVNDTELGQNSSNIGQAVVQFVGQNGGGEGVLVLDENSLKTALSTPGLNVITLNNDINLTDTVPLRNGSQTIIDLNGHTVTSNANRVFDAQNGANLILSDGTVVGNGDTGIYSVASSVSLNNVAISNVIQGLLIHDHKSALGADSTVHINQCDIDATQYGIFIHGNASTEEKTKIIVENSSITGKEYAGIITNGSNFGTDITVDGCRVNGKYAAAYFPQKDSVATLKNSILEGYTGIAVKGGEVNIIDCTVTGTGEYTPLPEDPTKLSNSGWWDTGDGVYLESNYSNWQTKINISGENTKITSTQPDTLAVRMYPTNAPKANIEITGGIFSSDVSAFLPDGYSISSTEEGYKVAKN